LLVGFSVSAITFGTAVQNPKVTYETRDGDQRPVYRDAELEAKHRPLSLNPIGVSMIQLIATPERFHNKAVRVTGFCHDEEEDTAIYLSTEDANYLNGRNALWVAALGNSGFNRKFVITEGIFDKEFHGHMDAYSGAIRDAWRIRDMKQRYNDHAADHRPPLTR
jgi:hypothetical protein